MYISGQNQCKHVCRDGIAMRVQKFYFAKFDIISVEGCQNIFSFCPCKRYNDVAFSCSAFRSSLSPSSFSVLFIFVSTFTFHTLAFCIDFSVCPSLFIVEHTARHSTAPLSSPLQPFVCLCYVALFMLFNAFRLLFLFAIVRVACSYRNAGGF